MIIQVACEALRQGKVLELQYDGYSCSVEVHACGYTELGHALARAWLVGGGATSGERPGWRLVKLDEAASAQITDQPSQAPRKGFKPDDPAMTRIVCEVSPRLAPRDPN